jgi:hypothetical protein
MSNNGTTVTYHISILAVEYYHRMTMGVVEILLSNSDNTVTFQSRIKYNRPESDLFWVSFELITHYSDKLLAERMVFDFVERQRICSSPSPPDRLCWSRSLLLSGYQKLLP